MVDIQSSVSEVTSSSDRYVIAISGGVDSAVLTHIFHKLELNFRTVFINHNQKGSKELMQSAQALSDILKLNHKCIETDIKIDSSETVMREARYEVLNNDIDEKEILVTAHHRDDKIETFFINLLRGTRLKGLTSIALKRKNIIRPLINTSKSQIIEYAKDNDIYFQNDITNFDNSISRNWIRNELIPEVENRFPGNLNNKITDLILEIEESTKEDTEIKKYIKYAPGYFEIPACLLKHNSSETNYLLSIISQLVGQSGLQTSDIKNMFKALSSGKQVSYFENWIVSQQLGLLIFVNKEEWKFKQNTNSFGYFQFVTTEYWETRNNWSLDLQNISNDQISFESVSPGDFIILDNKKQKVSEVLRSSGIQDVLREVWPLVKKDDEVIWIPGLRKSDNVKVKEFESTKNINIITASIEKSTVGNF
jgi:tRNA(Ile)-lysidine synthase